MPSPVAVTFSQAVQHIIKHRMANPAIVVKHGLSTDQASVENELENYTRARLGIPQESPKRAPLPYLSQAAGGAVAALKQLAAGAALLMEWEETGVEPASAELSESRSGICVGCPKNSDKTFSQWFSQPVSEVYRKKLARLTQLSMSTVNDSKLGVCEACLCPLKLKVHAPIDLIKKYLKPEVKSALDPRCWILTELKE